MKIQVKRGNKAMLPALSDGEIGLAIDQDEVYMGNQGKNLQFLILENGGLPAKYTPPVTIVADNQEVSYKLGIDTNGLYLEEV